MVAQHSQDSGLYRTKVPKTRVVLLVGIAVFSVGWAAVVAYLAYGIVVSNMTADTKQNYLARLSLLFVVSLGLGAWTLYILTRELLAMKRSSVRVDDRDGVMITDWRGRTSRVPWAEVTAVRVWRAGGVLSPGPAVVVCQQGTIHVPYWLASRDAALEDIIHGAKLTTARHGWWTTAYEHSD